MAGLKSYCMMIATALASSTNALPSSLLGRQTWTGLIAHDLTTFGCRPVILIFARETYSPGNMGSKVGPQLSDGLKAIFGPANVATEGVDYLAAPDTNFLPLGGPPKGIAAMQVLLRSATTLCPNSAVVASGYSQGAALAHRAIEGLETGVKNRIAGVVTFGDTLTLQDGERILGYPANKTLIICNTGDVICDGWLWVVPTHLDYTRRVPEAVAFLRSRIVAAGVRLDDVRGHSGSR